MRVTDEMVQSALDAYENETWNSDDDLACMRAALEAALSHAAGQDVDYVMVPRTMTDAMIACWLTPEQMAGGKSGGDMSPHAGVIRRFNRMLSAASQVQEGDHARD